MNGVEITFNRHQGVSNDRSIHIVAHLTHTCLILPKSLNSFFKLAQCSLLSCQAQLRREEGVGLSHRLLRAAQAVENEFSKKRVSHISRIRDTVLAFAIHEETPIGSVWCRDVDVFPQLDVAFRSKDYEPSVTSRPQAGRREPIHLGSNPRCRCHLVSCTYRSPPARDRRDSRRSQA